MPYPTLRHAVLGALVVPCILMTPAHALTPRTYVATYGSDANSCNAPVVPCQNLSAGITKVDPGGVVTVLDTVSTATAFITKSLTIIAVGGNQMQFLSAFPAPGEPDAAIHVSAAPDDVVVLDGVGLKGFGNGIRGIRFNSGGRLHVRNCQISGYPGGIGIDIRSPGPSRVTVSNCTISGTRDAIFVRPTANNRINVLLDHVTLEGNSRAGVRAFGGRSIVRINDSRITNNGIGLDPLNNAKIISFSNNVLVTNDNNGQPTSTIPLQ